MQINSSIYIQQFYIHLYTYIYMYINFVFKLFNIKKLWNGSEIIYVAGATKIKFSNSKT